MLLSLLNPAYGWWPITLSEFVSGLFRVKRGDVCGKRLTFMYTSTYEHVLYNV